MSAVEAVDGASVEVPAASRADRELESLYARHSNRVLRFCRRHLRSQHEAEDAVQTTFLHALRALRRGVVPISEAAWLFKIAENVCLSAHRSNGRRSEREVVGGELVELAPAREQRGDVLFGLEAALATIPDRQRRAFVLRELRGLSHREIAAETGTSVAAVETLIFRARRSLARALDAGAGLKGRVGGLLDVGAVIKTLCGGVAAAKVAAVAAVVAVSAVSVSDSVKQPKREHQLLVVGEETQPPTPSAAPEFEHGTQPPAGRGGRPASRRHRPNRMRAIGANIRTGHPRPRPSVDRPRTDQEISAPGSSTAPGLPPIAVRAPATPPLAPPAVPPIAVTEVLPVSRPTLPELPSLPVQLAHLEDQLPPLPRLP